MADWSNKEFYISVENIMVNALSGRKNSKLL